MPGGVRTRSSESLRAGARAAAAISLGLIAAPGCGAVGYECNDPMWLGVQDIDVSLEEARQELVFEGTLVDEDGAPIPNVKVNLYLRHPTGTGSGNYGRVAGTDSEGVYRTDLSVLFAGPRDRTLENAVGYSLSFQPRNKVRGVNYCDEVVERRLTIRAGDGDG